MTSKQRAYLRSLASSIDTIFQLGKNGINDEIIFQLDNALDSRELIKIKALDTFPVDIKKSAEEIAERTNSELVQVIGKKIVLFRVSSKEENRKIDLKKIK